MAGATAALRKIRCHPQIITSGVLLLCCVAFDARAGGQFLALEINDVNEVSNADTAVAVGTAYRYEDGTLTALPLPATCELNSVSDDGVFLAGVFCITGQYVGFRWNWDTGDIDDLSAIGGSQLRVEDLSADGSVVAGKHFGSNLAFRWSATSGMTLLGDLPGGGVNAEASGVSADGQVVVGTAESEFGGTPIQEAFRWKGGVTVGLGNFSGAGWDQQSEAAATSADGAVVVGRASVGRFSQPYRGFRWTEESGMTSLGQLPGPAHSGATTVHDVSGDGVVVVGETTSPGNPNTAFVWDPEFGMRRLQDVLENEFELDTSAFRDLLFASAISTDARVIGGRGDPVAGSAFRWLAILPHPPGQFGCNIEMSKPSYTDGEPVQITTLRYANLGEAPLGTRLRLELDLPIPRAISILDLGASGTFAIPAGLNVNLAPITMFTVHPGQPRGAYTLRCTLEEAGTGRVQAEDWMVFELS